MIKNRPHCPLVGPQLVSRARLSIGRPMGADGKREAERRYRFMRPVQLHPSISSAFHSRIRSIIPSFAVIASSVFCAGLLILLPFDSSLAQQSPTPTETRQARPDEPGSAVTDAVKLMGQGRHAEAIAKLETAIKTAPRDPRLRFTYGLVLADQGKTTEAIDVLTQLTQDYPELPEPFNNLAVLHAARGDLDKARFALENALRALPNYSLGHENLGDLYLRLAARSYEQANASDRANTAAQSKLVMTRELLTRVTPPAKSQSPAAPATTSPNTAAPRQ